MEYFIITIVIILVFNFIAYYNKKRRETLMEKYQNEEIVERMMKKMVWQDQTAEQLIDSLGKPLDIEQTIMKGKTREIWKYQRLRKGRYGLRITLENGLVVGWNKKVKIGY